MPTNFLLQSQGTTVDATTTLDSKDGRNWFASFTNNGVKGVNWLAAGGIYHSQANNISAGAPQIVTLDLGQSRTLNRLIVETPGANSVNGSLVNATTTFEVLGLTAYKLQYLDGAAWTDVPGAAVTGNNQVLRTLNFAPLATTQIRMLCTASSDGFARVGEIEGYGIAPPPADITVLIATVIGPTQIDLDWNDVAGATYAIEYSVDPGFSSSSTSTSSVSNKSITALMPDTQYYFRVRSEKDGAYSNWISIDAKTPEMQSALDDYFERFFLSEIFNITQLDLEMPVLRADFGNGYEAAALSGKSSGLRYWSISAEVLPDLPEYSVDYKLAGDDLTDARFQYFWEFYRRHLSLGNKPFYFVDPRTNRKFLASFVDNRISFEAITSKLYRGGVQIKQRRVKNNVINFRAEDGSVSN